MSGSTGSDGGARSLRRRLILVLLVAAVATAVVVVVIVGTGAGGMAAPGGAASTGGPGSTVPPVPIVGEVVSDGYAAPRTRIELASESGGTIAAIPVAVGDRVAAGAPLVVLDDTDLAAQLEQAQRTAEAAGARTAQAEALVTQAEQQVAVAQANLDQAAAALATARDANVGEDEAAAARDAARAGVQVARAGLAAAQEAAKAAAADQAAAEAGAGALAARRDALTLRAPFAGTVASIPATVGEVVQPGQVVVRVADPGAWEFIADELDESGIARVKVGAPATVTLDGVPGVRIPATVARAGSYGVARQGGIVYEVVVVPTGEVPDGVRWNMTATIAIEAGE